MFWAAASKAVLAKRLRVLGSLVLAEQTVKVDDEAALPVLIKVCCRSVCGDVLRLRVFVLRVVESRGMLCHSHSVCHGM